MKTGSQTMTTPLNHYQIETSDCVTDDHLPPTLRNNGLGTAILTQFESEGCKRGCVAGFLYTITFQAPNFYKKNGWKEFGRIDCLPEGTSRIFMNKSF